MIFSHFGQTGFEFLPTIFATKTFRLHKAKIEPFPRSARRAINKQQVIKPLDHQANYLKNCKPDAERIVSSVVEKSTSKTSLNERNPYVFVCLLPYFCVKNGLIRPFWSFGRNFPHFSMEKRKKKICSSEDRTLDLLTYSWTLYHLSY